MIQVNRYDTEGKYVETVEENFFGECERVLNYLKEERVCDIGYSDSSGKFWINEMCDEWYAAELSVENCRDLADLFTKMADRIEINNTQ